MDIKVVVYMWCVEVDTRWVVEVDIKDMWGY